MPRYFFNLRHGAGASGLAIDPDGDELASVEDVRAHALMVARDLIDRTPVHSVRDWFECAFEVTDENGQPVMPVPFGVTVTEEPDEA